MSDTKGKIVELDLNDILPNRLQPRIKFNEDSIMELSESIKVHGVLQPIIVRPISDKYEIIAGERRYKASVIAGLETIPAMIIAYNDKDSAEIALIENIQRKDLTSIEEAISYKKILDMGYLTQEQLALKLGKSQSAIANKIRLLNLCDEVQEALMEEKISERHARSLLKLKKSSSQRFLLKRIIKERLTVRKTDDEIEKILKGEIVIELDDDDKEEKLETNLLNVDLKEETKQDKDNDKENNKSSDFDITNFFDEHELDEFLKIIDAKDSDKQEDKNEIINSVEIKESDEQLVVEEPKIQNEISIQNDEKGSDSMINDYQQDNNETSQGGKFFNISNNISESQNNSFFNNSDLDSSSNKINNLMAPEGTKNIFSSEENSIQDTIFSSVDSNEKTSQGESMFTNLMKSQDIQQDNGFVDGDTFGKFLDPSYVDGSKKEASQDSNVSSSVFAKFLDQNYDTQTNNSNNQIMQTQSISEEKPVILNEPTSIDNNKFDFLLSAEKPVTSEVVNDSAPVQAVDLMPKEKPIDLLRQSYDSVENTQNEAESKDINSLMDVGKNSNIPDLLAPMNSENDIKPNLLGPMSQSINNDNNISANSFSSLFGNDNPVIQPEDNVLSINNKEVNSSVHVDSLTPDNSIIANEDNIEPEMDTTASIPVSLDHPFFVTASTPNVEPTMPTTPIIDSPESSVLLSPSTPVQPEPVIEPTTEPTSISETIQPEPEIEIPGPVSNQTIIVTDYNKQYDPIFPDTPKVMGPQVDMKDIIGMIRDLGDKIEQYGYSIDVEEIDLTDIYQVTFNIVKK